MSADVRKMINESEMSKQIDAVSNINEQILGLAEMILDWNLKDTDTIANILLGIHASFGERLNIIEELQMQKAGLDFQEGFECEAMPCK